MSDDRTTDVARLAEALRTILWNPTADGKTGGRRDVSESHIAAALLPVVDAIARQRTAEVIECRDLWTAAQALDDAADEILTEGVEFGGPEDSFHWLTDRSARIRIAAALRATS